MNQIKYSKFKFISSTIGFIIVLFFLGHIGLVTIYKLGRAPTVITGIISFVIAVSLLMRQDSHRFFPLITGFLLWAVFGEIAEHLGYGDIVSINNIFVLLAVIILMSYLIYRKVLSEFQTIALVLFMIIWTFHFIMVNQFEQLGKTHIITCLSSPVFLIIFIFSLFRCFKSDSQTTLSIHSILLTCSFWSILEYLWAWKVIPKLW